MKLNANESEANLGSNFASQNDIDWHKVSVVAKKSVPWVGLIFIFCM